jgi:transglycosylase-like protein
VHGGPPPVQSRSDEHDRIPVETSLTPLMARTVANRRAARPRHLVADGADRADTVGSGDPDRRPRRTGAIAAIGVVLLLVAVAAMAALWPRTSGDSVGLEASGVTTTEPPFGDDAERASANRSEPATTEPGSTTESTGSTSSTGSTGSTGSTSTETAGDGGTGTTGSTGTTSGTEPASPTTSGSTSSTSTAPPSTAPPPASAPAATTTTTAPPSTTAAPPGDPRQDSTWDTLARCETGGNWSYNRDGRYGGLRMRDEDWRDYGGRGYPNQYSRDTQIAVARRIQAAEGWDYWRRCARELDYD